MIKLKPYSASILTLGGSLLIAMGLYFIFLRPPLLTEDLSYMGSTMQNINETTPGILKWLQKVFWVMGSYIFTTGLLTIFISHTSFRTRARGSFGIVAITGISSITFMTVVNFMIDSDFKWLLLIFNLPLAVALILYRYRI